MNPKQPVNVWQANAQRWHHVGPPLRPCEEDGRMMLELAAPAFDAAGEGAEIVILGVTPEVVQLAWPPSARIHAFDQSAEMIAKVWKPHTRLRSDVRTARWQSMPLADDSVDCAAGDGSLNALQSLSEFPDVLREVARVLRKEGVLVLRMFIRPEMRSSLDEVEALVRSGGVQSFHALKWHVAMALSQAPDFSVRVANIHAALMRMFPDRAELAAMRGWPREVIEAIDSYEGVETRYSFPTLAAVREVCAPFFELAEMRTGSYEIAERCPTVLFRPRSPRPSSFARGAAEDTFPLKGGR